MTAKPSPVCKLKTGESIYAQKNFVQTWNWLVDTMSHLDEFLQEGKSIKIVKKASGKFEISAHYE